MPLPDSSFTCPRWIAEDQACSDLVDLYNHIIDRMREEARGFAMNTVQELLIERIAANYIILRWRERKGVGEQGAFEHSTAAKDFNSFWLSMTREFNNQLKITDKDFREAVISSVQEAINNALSDMPPDEVVPIRAALSRAFEDAGL